MSSFRIIKKQLEKIYFKDIPAWLSLILAAHRVQLVGRAKAMSPYPPRITILVIRSALNTAMSQARTS